tara:strand:+ start:1340 stop:1984 length:645 start_codon:yes stop_codon:yes gene_type:complete
VGVVHEIKNTLTSDNVVNNIGMFPTPVQVITNTAGVCKKDVHFCVNTKYGKNTGNSRSVDSYILNQKELKNLKGWIDQAVFTYFLEIYKPMHEVSLKITQSWTNKTCTGEFNHPHTHPNSFISGVYYFKGNEDDKIFFSKNQYEQIEIPTKDHTLANTGTWWLPAKEGTLILFPSSLLHWVETVRSKNTRYSLAFNTFPVGLVGDKEALTELKV